MAEPTAQDTDTTVDVDTSTDTSDDSSLEDIEVSLEDMESSEEDVTEEPEEETEESEAKDETEDTEEETVDEEAEDTTAKKPEEGKPDPDKARQAFEERELRRQIQKEEREKQERITLDRYLKEAQDDQEELEARALQVERYNINKEKAVLNEQKLTAGITRAKAEIELLRDTDPVVQEALGDALDNFQAMNVVLNDQGDIVDVRGDVFQYLQRTADSIAKLRGVGARQESKNKAKQKSRAMTPPSAKPKESKADPMMEGFDEEAGKW